MKKYQELIEREIRKQKFGSQPVSLYEPIRYIMALGGKRLRPMLTLLAYQLYRRNVEKAVPYAVAVEAFHNFSLIHDDIMDHAPLRRGKPTVHERWNVNTAILSGDVMLVKVYDMLAQLDAKTLHQVLPLFNKCAAEVCEGQQWDMEFESKPRVTERQYIEMIRLKTAVLLGFSLRLGALLAGAGRRDQQLLTEFGEMIGIGFQLTDDLLDVYGDQTKFGKQVGGDILANKKTILLINAIQRARGAQQQELQKWLSAKEFDPAEKVNAVRSLYDELKIPALTERRIAHYFNDGLASLTSLGKRVDVKTIREFTLALMERAH